jgi:hypothetical protein
MAFRERMFIVHAAALVLAFILVFPAGYIAINLRSSKSFQYHWVLQVTGSVLAAIGVIIGLVLAPDISAANHKQLGITIAILLVLQILSGWRRHADFVKIRRRIWISSIHVWLGILLTGAGWCNILSGLSLGGFSDKSLYISATIMCSEAIALTAIHYKRRRTSAIKPAQNIALVGDNSDSDEESMNA